MSAVKRAFTLSVGFSLALIAAHSSAARTEPLPRYLERVDNQTGSGLIRVTDPGVRHGSLDCQPSHCRHRYASSQAWNADLSLIAIASGCSGICFLDGKTFEPRFHRRPPGDCEWHPTNAAEMICVTASAVVAWRPSPDIQDVVVLLDGYSSPRFGPGKGNPSLDGSRLAVVATRAADKRPVAFALDIKIRTKFPDIDLATLEGETSFCSISPSGQFVFCFQRVAYGNSAAIFDAGDARLIQHWPENHRPGHGDMIIDSSGDDAYVGISKSVPDKQQVIMRRLRDGYVTALTPRGFAQHVSARNTQRPGWVFVTYSGTSQPSVSGRGEPQFAIVAVPTDGSLRLYPITPTYAVKAGYRSEAHASAAPDGSRVIFASNWGERDGPIASYVVESRLPE